MTSEQTEISDSNSSSCAIAPGGYSTGEGASKDLTDWH